MIRIYPGEHLVYVPVYYEALDVTMKYVLCIILTINANDFLK